MEYLPAYAPELDLEEYCHGDVKRCMKNAVLHSKGEFVALWIEASPGERNSQMSSLASFNMHVSNLTNFGKPSIGNCS